MKPWTFVHVADIQPGSPRSYRYNPSWIRNWRQARAQILEIAPELMLVGGDLTRDGSIHRFELQEAKADLDALPSLGFLRYDVTGTGIEATFVPLEKTYQLEGYGPGGHPAPHARHYSLAWGTDDGPA